MAPRRGRRARPPNRGGWRRTLSRGQGRPPLKRRAIPRFGPGCARIRGHGAAGSLDEVADLPASNPSPSPSSLWKEHRHVHHLRTRPAAAGRARPASAGLAAAAARLTSAEAALKAFLERWSIPALRVALGTVFVAFGVLKFFPGVSPVEPLVEATWGVLTFGIVGGQLALVLTAVIETVAGALIISGRFARLGLVVLAVAFVGIFSPIVFFTDQLITAAGPTLLGQYVAKNVVLVAAALVVASRALRGPARER